MDNNAKLDSFQMLMLVATPKLAEKAAELFRRENLPIQYRLNAEGTASSQVMDMLGFGSIDKCLIISMMPKKYGDKMLGLLHSKLRLDTVNSGIAFTVPMSGANNLLLHILTKSTEKNSENNSGRNRYIMPDTKYSLIVAIVDRGFSGDVMEAARDAGAGGGTVVHSRRIASEDITGQWGLSLKDEKELVLIISELEKKLDIMQSINEKCGIQSEAKGMVMSLPIDSVMGI